MNLLIMRYLMVNPIPKNLFKLGSQHQAVKATTLRKFVDEKFPDNFFKNINFISVEGEVEIKSKQK